MELEGAQAKAWEHWCRLSLLSRPRGFGYGPIPVGEIKALCDAFCEEPEVFSWILEIEQLAYPRLCRSQETKEENKDAQFSAEPESASPKNPRGLSSKHD
ncbi:MAG: hypothetical protein A2508_07910 [Candidatus Lambdaproteobacteria bacterium RIFOXYD12_FULL_49_8]|nr:MAG: hypothetical protein A2508_07910 [Candidatus Lambdaproteobacteria bacterium RIFOXYD12_FULL_49_8]